MASRWRWIAQVGFLVGAGMLALAGLWAVVMLVTAAPNLGIAAPEPPRQRPAPRGLPDHVRIVREAAPGATSDDTYVVSCHMVSPQLSFALPPIAIGDGEKVMLADTIEMAAVMLAVASVVIVGLSLATVRGLRAGTLLAPEPVATISVARVRENEVWLELTVECRSGGQAAQAHYRGEVALDRLAVAPFGARDTRVEAVVRRGKQ